jgi:DnaJ-domain-containing protein 1
MTPEDAMPAPCLRPRLTLKLSNIKKADTSAIYQSAGAVSGHSTSCVISKMSFDEIRYYFFTGVMWICAAWGILSAIWLLTGFTIHLLSKERTDKGRSPAPDEEVQNQRVSIRLLVHLAHQFANNHGNDGLLPGHVEVISDRISRTAAGTKPEGRQTLEAELRMALQQTSPSPREYSELLAHLLGQKNTLDRDWIAELIKDALRLSQVITPTPSCMGTVREISERFGFKVNQRKEPHRPTTPPRRDRLGYYAVLGVPVDADQIAIKSSYRQLALLFHPDRTKDPDATERFRLIQKAYETLSDSTRREAYDQIP